MNIDAYNRLEFYILQTKEEIARLQKRLENLQELRDKFLKALEENEDKNIKQIQF